MSMWLIQIQRIWIKRSQLHIFYTTLLMPLLQKEPNLMLTSMALSHWRPDKMAARHFEDDSIKCIFWMKTFEF